MVANKKVTGRAKSLPVGIGIGLLGSIGITLCLAAVLAALIARETVAMEAAGYGAMGILLVSAGAGAWISAGLVKRQRLMVCLILGAAYYICLLSATALFFGGQYQGMGVTALVILAGVGAVILLGLKREGSGSKRRRKQGFR